MSNSRIIIENAHQYTQQLVNGNIIFTRINTTPYIDRNSLFEKNLRNSNIIECKINNINTNQYKYKSLLLFLYKNINNRELIIQQTNLNIVPYEKHNSGFTYHREFNFSIQGADARSTLKEIINMVNIMNYSMELKIQLQDGEILHFNI